MPTEPEDGPIRSRLGHDGGVIDVAAVLQPALTHTLAQLVPNMDGYIAVDQVQGTLSRWSTMV